MFLNFFNELRAAKVPVTLKEYLALMEAMDKGVIDRDVEDFYYLARAALVKDERNIDKFDKVFGHVFKGLDSLGEAVEAQDLPEEWLRKMTEKFLTPEEMEEMDAEFIVMIKGYDETFAQHVYSRSSYKPHEIRWGSKFTRIFHPDEDGTLIMDIDRIDETYEVELN